MYFPESEAIVREHRDLQRVVKLVDEQLSEIFSTAPLRPVDFACVSGSDVNQVNSVFILLAEKELLLRAEMVECMRCHALMDAVAFQQAVEDEDDFECISCGRPFNKRSKPIVVYRMAIHTASRSKPKPSEVDCPLPSGDEPLSERAQSVIVAMLELGAIDSDKRLCTEEIAARAIGANADANSLKAVMSDLNTRKLINTQRGRSGGCWLTASGQVRAKKIRNR